MPVLREVTIVNPTNSLTLQLTSISGDVPDFQTSFFKSKVKGEEGNRERERDRETETETESERETETEREDQREESGSKCMR